jgi:hypothetical protein
METRKVIQFGAAAALLLSGLVAARAASACGACAACPIQLQEHDSSAWASWGSCAKDTFDGATVGTTILEACGSTSSGTSSLFMWEAAESSFAPQTESACVDGYAYDNSFNYKGSGEEASFGSSYSVNTSAGPTKVLGIFQVCDCVF